MRLAQTQAELYKLVASRAGARPAMAARIVEGNDALTPLERVEIYTRQYPARMHDALAEDFPFLQKLMGDDAFWRLVTSYARAHPSAHHDLGRFGRELVPFLRARRRRLPRPDLPDLASLEWTRAQCFLAADAEPLGRDGLAGHAPEAFPALVLELIPGLTVLSLAYDALPLWQALDGGKRAPKPRRGARFAVVWRKGYLVFHAGVDALEAEALRRAQAGAVLAEVMAPWAEHAKGPQAAFKALASWLGEGMISGLRAGRAL